MPSRKLLFLFIAISFVSRADGEDYSVQTGDTLSRIAQKQFGFPIYGREGSLEKIMVLNPSIKSHLDEIFPGDKIIISPTEIAAERKEELSEPIMVKDRAPSDSEAPVIQNFNEESFEISILPRVAFLDFRQESDELGHVRATAFVPSLSGLDLRARTTGLRLNVRYVAENLNVPVSGSTGEKKVIKAESFLVMAGLGDQGFLFGVQMKNTPVVKNSSGVYDWQSVYTLSPQLGYEWGDDFPSNSYKKIRISQRLILGATALGRSSSPVDVDTSSGFNIQAESSLIKTVYESKDYSLNLGADLGAEYQQNSFNLKWQNSSASLKSEIFEAFAALKLGIRF